MVDRFEVEDTPVQRLATIIGGAGPIGTTVAAAAPIPKPAPSPIYKPTTPGPGGMA